ncbi:hypothetical protein [Falsibacillus pallidus]|uniref:Uncharacterized protein n=1 Tax=Falsibacillus pallidus TaxID=493781 RepID=A0A370GV78_9BACI|nr:hypothetical protein [Falsibacillus pallidus]RDI47431.1 hypothetical protein DFR59_10186 [Falsibacillus pallidus]
MSLKLVELQVAIPRTADASKAAENMLKQGAVINHEASNELEKEYDRKSRQVIENAKSNKTSDRNELSGQKDSAALGENKNPKEMNQAKHPYKGNTIDFSR